MRLYLQYKRKTGQKKAVPCKNVHSVQVGAKKARTKENKTYD